MTDIDIDVDYLNVNKLAYTFESLNSSNNNSLRQLAKDAARRALKIMNKYQSLHPSYKSMISYLSDENTEFTSEWAASVNKTNRTLMNKYTDELHDCLQDTDKEQIMEQIGSLAKIHTIQGNYQQIITTLNQFHSIIQFRSQPNDLNQFIQNKYIEFNFIQYTTTLYNLIWFPLNNESSSSANTSSLNAFKTINNYFKKVTLYYSKNEMLININNSNKEIQYYWLLNWLQLTVYFNQGKFDEFLIEFDTLINNDSALKPLDILNFDEVSLKTEILIMFKISIAITKPFKNLSLLNYEFINGECFDTETLFELFNDNDTFEFTVHEIFLNLSESNFKGFKAKFGDDVLINKLVGILGYTFPRNALSFIQFINNVVDFKNFLLIISITKRIPKSNLMTLLGYPNDYATNDLLLFISVLNLGELGIGYDYDNELFYNSGIKDNNLNEQITNLENRLTGESIANLIKGCLIEQALNS
ncbi:uncharacterized protein AC631_04463 [Debaryomyces fabryi]|uniref:PCI domain-containing protein n=1 Tax=Debaryomyces fabryi TaxID=58627 RepID=A0A0V1PU64_9ASCO|nr:uncharacterized protein AC631_04463 [Debaryomyces fabryi]KRZ99770.1 hypothetical protein AC631_04463 [Debaryomyces fabryi]CUM57271.1 unnamed protein product [Debaryomyces fabryi]